MKFFVLGSWYHLWFFPAIMISVCMVTIIFKVGLEKILIPLSIVMYIVGCLGTSYYSVGVQIPILGSVFQMDQFTVIRQILLMGFPFFVCGYLIYKIENKIKIESCNSSIIVALAVSLFIWIMEIWMVIKWNTQVNIVITPGLYFLVVTVLLFLLNHPCHGLEKLSEQCHIIANFTYYAHPLIILILTILIPDIEKQNTILFFMTWILTSIVGKLIYSSNGRVIKKLVK